MGRGINLFCLSFLAAVVLLTAHMLSAWLESQEWCSSVCQPLYTAFWVASEQRLFSVKTYSFSFHISCMWPSLKGNLSLDVIRASPDSDFCPKPSSESNMPTSFRWRISSRAHPIYISSCNCEFLFVFKQCKLNTRMSTFLPLLYFVQQKGFHFLLENNGFQ